MQKIQITRDHVKKATQVVVGYSVKKTVKMLILQNTSPEKTHELVSANIGAWMIGAMVADLAKTKTDAKVDNALDGIAQVKIELQKRSANKD